MDFLLDGIKAGAFKATMRREALENGGNIDEELLEIIKKTIRKSMISNGTDDVRKLGLLCDIWIELDELKDKKPYFTDYTEVDKPF